MAITRIWGLMLRGRRGITPNSVGGKLNDNLINFKRLESVQPDKLRPQQNMTIFIQKVRGQQVNQVAGGHGIQNPGSGAVGPGGDETCRNHVGIDDKNAGIHPETR